MQCAAINEFSSYPYIKGEQCVDEAYTTVDGQPLCWAHYHACNNLYRSEPVSVELTKFDTIPAPPPPPSSAIAAE